VAKIGALTYMGGTYRIRARGVWRSALEFGDPMDAHAALLREYLPILMFLGLAIALSVLMVAASLVIARQKPDAEKLSAYECGFEAFDDARRKFDVRFYLVAILFIIFDLEVAFLFPWAVSLGQIGMFGFWSMVVFLGVLTIGFIYEWKKGALEWE
jgi:NADH-quinone oxidoreductase subunit A